jgi:hypothetical protein
VHHEQAVHYSRVVGICVMVFVAFNDSMVAVLARKMKQVHFSIIMFWFAAVGTFILTSYLVYISVINQTRPSILTYTFS